MFNQDMYKLGSKRSVIREIFEYAKARSAEIGGENVFLFVEGVRWTEPKRSGSKKGGRRSARPKAIESSSQ